MWSCRNQCAPIERETVSIRMNPTRRRGNTHSNANVPNRPKTFSLYWVHLGLNLLQRDQFRLRRPICFIQISPIQDVVKSAKTYTSATAAATDAYLLFPETPARASGSDENSDFAVHSLAAGRPAAGGIRRALVAPVEIVRNDRHWDRIAAALMIANS